MKIPDFIQKWFLDYTLNKIKENKIMTKILTFLQGKKSYILMVVGVLVNGLYAMGYIDDKHVQLINYILAFLGLGAIKSAIVKSGQTPKE